MSVRHYVPNTLTFLRAIAAVAIIVLFFLPEKHFILIYWLFVGAVLTDYLDGKLARRWHTVSDIGVVFDPLCDKVLVLSLILLIYPYDIVWGPFLAILLVRDIVTDVLKNYLLSHGVKTPAIYSAKLKTTMQMIMLHFVLVYFIFPYAFFAVLANIFALAAVAFSLFSAAFYTRRFVRFMRKSSASSNA